MAKTATKKRTWMIRHFDDYHDIIYRDKRYDTGEKYNTLELGCYPVKDYGYNRYFGLFYKGRKPSLKRVYASMLRKVEFGENYNHYPDGDVVMTKEDLLYELKQVWKGE